MKSSRTSRTRVLWSVLAAAGFGCATSGCHRGDVPATAEQIRPIAVIAIAASSPMQNTLRVAGEFLPMQEVELHAKVAGYIRRINVDIGDRVRTGEVLATLDVPELSAQVEGADAGVRQTQEQILRARSEVDRAAANYDALHAAAQRLQQASNARPGLIAQQELDDALARDRGAAAQVDAAKSGLSATQQQLGVSRADRQRYSAIADYSRIVAPFNGIVTWRYADTGSLIQAGTSNAGSMPVVKVAQIDTLRLRLPVPETLASFVKLGDIATIRVQALGQTFTGRISRSTGNLDPSTRTMQVEIDVPNAAGNLSPGMYADVSLNIQRTGDALAVPVQAVDQTGSQAFVLLVDTSNTVRRRNVRVGISNASQVEILSGLNQGDRVITANLASFQDGESVTPKQSAINLTKSDGGDQ